MSNICDIIMKFRKYGENMPQMVLIHGGPGACGELSPLAQTLSEKVSVLEPLLTPPSLTQQLIELEHLIRTYCKNPIILLGHSAGALLSYIFTAQNPVLIKKLILVGSGCFEEPCAKDIMKTRLARLDLHDKKEVLSLIKILENPTIQNKNIYFKKLGDLIEKADSFDTISTEKSSMTYSFKTYEIVWNEFVEIRRTGALLSYGKNIHCPVIAIHGEYDPHPSEKIRKSLLTVLTDFHFILLKKCGHRPWLEKSSAKTFLQIIYQELNIIKS